MVAHKETMGNEGGSNFNPRDKGNVLKNGVVIIPTYKGIAPAFWNNWRGFLIISRTIESMVKMPLYGTRECMNWVVHLDKQLAALPALQELVLTFYRVNFWEANKLDQINNQTVANWIYDHAVNGGGTGIKWIQEAAGCTADGSIGPKSIEAINAADPAGLITNAMQIAREHRLDICRRDPTQKQFLKSWLRRDGFSDDDIQAAIAMV